jgi:hypothetical protein
MHLPIPTLFELQPPLRQNDSLRSSSFTDKAISTYTGRSYVVLRTPVHAEGRSAQLTLTTMQPRQSIQVLSVVNASLSDFDQKNGLWLTADQATLLALGP